MLNARNCFKRCSDTHDYPVGGLKLSSALVRKVLGVREVDGLVKTLFSAFCVVASWSVAKRRSTPEIYFEELKQ